MGKMMISLFCREATVESEMLYMLQPSRIYIGDNINVFGRGKEIKVIITFTLTSEKCSYI